jgi:peptidyl-dipeptidase Dcp
LTATIATPTFFNVIEPLEMIDRELYQVSSIFFNLNLLNKTEEIESISSEMTEISGTWDHYWGYNKKLFNQVQQVYKNQRAGLSPIQLKLLDNTFQKLVKNGAHLEESAQQRLQTIDEEISALELKFADHSLKDSNQYGVLATSSEIEGLGSLEVQKAALQNGSGDYFFTHHYLDHILMFAKNRELRRRAYVVFLQNGHRLNKNNNDSIVLALINLRKEKANILGFKNFTHLTLDGRMSKNLGFVSGLLDKIHKKALVKTQRDLKTLNKLAQRDNIPSIEAWDLFYYKNLSLKQTLNLDEAELKKYFPLKKVWEGLQKLIFEMYQVKFKEVEYQTYNDKVKVFEVSDAEGNKLGTLFLDLFNRSTKQDGAWMDCFIDPGLNRLQTVVVACDFNDLGDCLLMWEEVKTLFHEMGHALHSLLSKAYYPSQAGTSVDWDFLELPSQFMENWVEEEIVLDWISEHHQTGAKLPVAMIKSLSEMNNFCNGFGILKQIFLTRLDFAYHTTEEKITDVERFEKSIHEKWNVFPFIPGTARSSGFGHVFEGDYASSYYSYLWASVLDRDAFFQCKKTGLLKSPYIARFKSLLEKGSTIEESVNYKEFKGSEPSLDAFLMSNDLNLPSPYQKLKSKFKSFSKKKAKKKKR